MLLDKERAGIYRRETQREEDCRDYREACGGISADKMPKALNVTLSTHILQFLPQAAHFALLRAL